MVRRAGNRTKVLFTGRQTWVFQQASELGKNEMEKCSALSPKLWQKLFVGMPLHPLRGEHRQAVAAANGHCG